MKYGRGAKKSRRRAWVFGMIERTTKRLFLYVCPRDGEGKYKRTRRALIPMILANVEPGSVLYTDGWRAYRRLNEYGYQHHWVNHDLYYCDPSDPSINTNMIEGLWAQIKRWLPRAGSYNLTEYLDLTSFNGFISRNWMARILFGDSLIWLRSQTVMRLLMMRKLMRFRILMERTEMMTRRRQREKSGFKRSPEMTIWSSVAKGFKHCYLYSWWFINI